MKFLLCLFVFVNSVYAQTPTKTPTPKPTGTPTSTSGGVWDKELNFMTIYSADTDAGTAKKGGNYGVYYSQVKLPVNSKNVVILHRYIYTFPVGVNKLNAKQKEHISKVATEKSAAFQSKKDCFVDVSLAGHASPRPGKNEELAKTRAKTVYDQIKAEIKDVKIDHYASYSDKYPVDIKFKITTTDKVNALADTDKEKALDFSQRVELEIPDANIKKVLENLPINFGSNAADINIYQANKDNLDFLIFALKKCEGFVDKIQLTGYSYTNILQFSYSGCSSLGANSTICQKYATSSALIYTYESTADGKSITGYGMSNGRRMSSPVTAMSADDYKKLASTEDYGEYVTQQTDASYNCRNLAKDSASSVSGSQNDSCKNNSSIPRVNLTDSATDQKLYSFPFNRQSLTEARAKSVLEYLKASTYLSDDLKSKISAKGAGADFKGLKVDMVITQKPPTTK